MSTLKQRNILATFGYMRVLSKQFEIDIPDDIIEIIIIFYGKTYKVYIKGRFNWSKRDDTYLQLKQLSKLVQSPDNIYHSGSRIFVQYERNVYIGNNNYEKSDPLKFEPLKFEKMDNNDYIDIISNGPDPNHVLFVSKNFKQIYGAGYDTYYQLFGHRTGAITSSLDLTCNPTLIPLSQDLFKTDPIIKIRCGK